MGQPVRHPGQQIAQIQLFFLLSSSVFLYMNIIVVFDLVGQVKVVLSDT